LFLLSPISCDIFGSFRGPREVLEWQQLTQILNAFRRGNNLRKVMYWMFVCLFNHLLYYLLLVLPGNPAELYLVTIILHCDAIWLVKRLFSGKAVTYGHSGECVLWITRSFVINYTSFYLLYFNSYLIQRGRRKPRFFICHKTARLNCLSFCSFEANANVIQF